MGKFHCHSISKTAILEIELINKKNINTQKQYVPCGIIIYEHVTNILLRSGLMHSVYLSVFCQGRWTYWSSQNIVVS